MFRITDKQDTVPLAVLAITQTAAWGMIAFMPVVGSTIAAELGMSLVTAFAGLSVMCTILAVFAPVANRLFARFGPRSMMLAGCPPFAAGLLCIALSQAAPQFFAGWALCGLGGAALMTTAAHIYLTDMAGKRARSLVGILLLSISLANSIFFIVTAILDALIGWRITIMIYAGVAAFAFPLLLLLGLPRVPHGKTAQGDPLAMPLGLAIKIRNAAPLLRSPMFWTITGFVAINSFICFGIGTVGIEIFRAMGAEPEMAIIAASALALFKSGGRLADVVSGQSWDGLTIALTAGAMMPCGLILLTLCGDTLPGFGAFILFFGMGSGGFVIARAVLPMAYYHGAEYSQALGIIGLPLYIAIGMAPPMLAMLLTATGPLHVLLTLAGLALTSFVALFALSRANDPGLARG